MELHMPPPEVIPFGLRAMKTVALSNGRFDQAERDMMAAAQSALGASYDVDSLPTISPAELAAAIPDPQLREQLLSGLIVMTMLDGEATRQEADVVEQFAAGLQVDPSYVRTLRKLVEGHTVAVRFDLARRIWVRGKVAEQWAQGGVRWLARSLASLLKLKEDSALLARYRALTQYPAGSLGRAYADFVERNGFQFPGALGAGPDTVIYHDLTHVLSGYDTDAAGETQVAAFHAGARRKDPFTFIFFVVLQFHLGMRMTPIAQAQHGFFDPGKVLLALRRGAACKIDPTDGWDPWLVMDRPLEDLRQEYGIPPLPPEPRK